MSKENTKFVPTQFAADLMRQGYSVDEVQKIMKEKHLVSRTFSSVLNELMGRRNLTVDILAGQAEIDPATIYRFMNQQRNPSRNTLLRICLAMGASLDETQQLLKSGNCAALSSARSRDLLIMDGIINGKYFDDVNQAMRQMNFSDLNSRG